VHGQGQWFRDFAMHVRSHRWRHRLPHYFSDAGESDDTANKSISGAQNLSNQIMRLRVEFARMNVRREHMGQWFDAKLDEMQQSVACVEQKFDTS
jgi:hypothetical protein